MKTTWAIARREFLTYFNSPIAYVFITVFLAFSTWLFFRSFFLFGQAEMRSFFVLLPWTFLVFIPAVTMRLWAEERKMGTFELLMSFPVTTVQSVLGKFVAGVAFVLIALALSFPLPAAVAYLGDPDWGPILGGYAGALLMASAYIAVGCFLSSITENQIIAFILTALSLFFLYVLSDDIILSALPGFLVSAASFLGVSSHYENVARGLLDSRDVLYFLSIMILGLLLNTYAIEVRRWR
ncbi:MAG: ABC transporter permease [Nitrospirae bacterium]|nr:ABC transporter permease [Nitrospirota bacterium]